MHNVHCGKDSAQCTFTVHGRACTEPSAVCSALCHVHDAHYSDAQGALMSKDCSVNNAPHSVHNEHCSSAQACTLSTVY